MTKKLNAEYLREYFNRPEIKEKHKETMRLYMKTYNRRPEVAEKRKKYMETRRDYFLDYMKEYNAKPEVKESKRLYALRKRQEERNQKMINEIIDKNDTKTNNNLK